MNRLKYIATLTALTGALGIPALALAEPTPPQGTTVNTIPLTTVQTNMRGSDGSMNTTSGTRMGSMASNMHGSISNAGHGNTTPAPTTANNMATPMTSDMDISNDAPPSATERRPDTLNQTTMP